jgi:hypothetical protein
LDQRHIQYLVKAQVAAADAAVAVARNDFGKKPAKRSMSLINRSDEQLKLMKQNVELERLLTELSEYVAAKEMQLGTFKQVNETLQWNLSKQAALCVESDGKGDV